MQTFQNKVPPIRLKIKNILGNVPENSQKIPAYNFFEDSESDEECSQDSQDCDTNLSHYEFKESMNDGKSVNEIELKEKELKEISEFNLKLNIVDNELDDWEIICVE